MESERVRRVYVAVVVPLLIVLTAILLLLDCLSAE